MSSFGDKKTCKLCHGDPDWGRQNLFYPNRGQFQNFWQKENQSISVINNFFPDHFLKILNGTKLDFYILKG